MRYTTSTVFLRFFVTVRRSCATWAAPSNPIQAGASTALMVRRARRPWSVLTEETAGTAAQGSFLSCRYNVGMLALTKKATDYDVSVPCCRARSRSRRWRIPLYGCRPRAYAFRHVDGVPHLKVE